MSRVLPSGELNTETERVANLIAGKSNPVIKLGIKNFNRLPAAELVVQNLNRFSVAKLRITELKNGGGGGGKNLFSHFLFHF